MTATLKAIEADLYEILKRTLDAIAVIDRLTRRPMTVDEVGTSPRARAKRPGPPKRLVEGVRQPGARSEEPASPPTSSPKEQSRPHPWRPARQARANPPKPTKALGPVVPLGRPPAIPAIEQLPECPCVNPDAGQCASRAPTGVHTRGSGGAAQFSKCRFYDVRMALANRPKRRFNGASPAAAAATKKRRLFGHPCPGCGKQTGNRMPYCKDCGNKGRPV